MGIIDDVEVPIPRPMSTGSLTIPTPAGSPGLLSEDLTTSALDGSSTKLTRAASASELVSDDSELTLARSFRRAGKEMRNHDVPAHWLCAHRLTPQQQGEEMLQEQFALDERSRFERLIRPSNGTSAMRSHVAQKISCRLRKEREHDATSILNIQHKCMNIRKNISSLANLRKDISGLRLRVETLGHEKPERDTAENH